MNITYNSSNIHPLFLKLPEDIQREILVLIIKVNEDHLHNEDGQSWGRVHFLITEFFATNFNAAEKKKDKAVAVIPADQLVIDDTQGLPKRTAKVISALHAENFNSLREQIQNNLDGLFHDSLFVAPILQALQNHIFSGLNQHAELINLICRWIQLNSMYLPLGTHLVEAYKADMSGVTHFYQYVMARHGMFLIPEALSEKTIARVTAFLAEAAQANCRTCPPPGPLTDRPTAIMLTCKNGAGGHTAPTQAMASRLKESGWRVEMVYYDTDLKEDADAYRLLGITFADGSPMTEDLFMTRWQMQKQQRKVSDIVRFYVHAKKILEPDLFVDDSGGELLRGKILPLNPQLIVTTSAYHWSWRSAYRVPTVKTILVASDVFFHREAIFAWNRQKNMPAELRQIYFTTMTDDLELLKGMAQHHDNFFKLKFPGRKLDSMQPFFGGFELDDQIDVIGAPIHPSFNAVTDPQEIQRLRKKWNVPDGAVSVCISRGKLGYDTDLVPALEGYRTQELLPKPVVLHVVCGENRQFYERLCEGSHANLAPNITIIPHPLLKPADFAEIRAISTMDDIKAGGGSTFEGWYLISKGAESLLLLTPGRKLWWERSNCDAMEKWGIGRTVEENSTKIPVLKEILEKGLPKIKYSFPDWKKPFDHLVTKLLTK